MRKLSEMTATFCPFCGGNHNQVDCVQWQERVEQDEARMVGTDFGGVVDVAPLKVEKEEVAVHAPPSIVVRLPMAVAESVAGVRHI